MNEEQKRLAAARLEGEPWRKWGPYLSERQWGTVREDYSTSGDAWNYLSHDASRSRAYRWGEDGLCGFSDDKQILCLSLGLWNERDAILKERLFGLTNGEGNHGEDVKEYYFYLDSTPTHSYLKYLYKYPQRAYPYLDLVEKNRSRSRWDLEYELMDTGIFDDDRYFDVFVEVAKASPEDLLMEIEVWNRGPEAASLRLLPTLWFRNTWGAADPVALLEQVGTVRDATVISSTSPVLGEMFLHCQPGGEALFTDNETNPARGPVSRPDARYFKDGINDYVVDGRKDAVNPARRGTKASMHYRLTVPSGGCVSVRLRLSTSPPDAAGPERLGDQFSEVLRARKAEADRFYDDTLSPALGDDQKLVARQALAGMLWTKQFYDYDVTRWLTERGKDPSGMQGSRNAEWPHMVSGDIISMPDKWEYPWYAAWDLAFHSLPLGLVDPEFAKEQLLLPLETRFLHPSGQVPAYEWNFGDVNPPVHAWAAYFLYQQERQRTGKADLSFLRRVYDKLLLNFTWWVNRKDPSGRNVFQGGFLGLDNIGVFDRSAPLPTGGSLEQADGTAWMAFYAQVMLQISVELALHDPSSGDMAIKFFEHFIWIASAMTHIGGQDEMWDEEDGFFYDVLRTPDGRVTRLNVRSMVGLLPLCAATVLTTQVADQLPELQQRAGWFVQHRPNLVASIHDPRLTGYGGRHLLALMPEARLRRVLARMLDEEEFLSPFGIRSLSRAHAAHPYHYDVNGTRFGVGYLPAESDSGMFGGNSNWRGPIWMPVNALLVRALINYYGYYGDDFRIECPTGSGRMMTLYEVAKDLTDRLGRIFTLDDNRQRPVFGGTRKFTTDPLWRDNVLFFEYFHGDNGAGIGASHQTGWTGLVAPLLDLFARTTAKQVLETFGRSEPTPSDRPKLEDVVAPRR
jgi:hypothetical protein